MSSRSKAAQGLRAAAALGLHRELEDALQHVSRSVVDDADDAGEHRSWLFPPMLGRVGEGRVAVFRRALPARAGLEELDPCRHPRLCWIVVAWERATPGGALSLARWVASSAGP